VRYGRRKIRVERRAPARNTCGRAFMAAVTSAANAWWGISSGCTVVRTFLTEATCSMKANDYGTSRRKVMKLRNRVDPCPVGGSEKSTAQTQYFFIIHRAMVLMLLG